MSNLKSTYEVLEGFAYVTVSDDCFLNIIDNEGNEFRVVNKSEVYDEPVLYKSYEDAIYGYSRLKDFKDNIYFIKCLYYPNNKKIKNIQLYSAFKVLSLNDKLYYMLMCNGELLSIVNEDDYNNSYRGIYHSCRDIKDLTDEDTYNVIRTLIPYICERTSKQVKTSNTFKNISCCDIMNLFTDYYSINELLRNSTCFLCNNS